MQNTKIDLDRKFAIIDIETTGGNYRRDRIIEIAIILHDGKSVINSYQTLINPERSIPPFITNLTGIHDEMVFEAPKFYEVAKEIVQWTEDAVFVAHHSRFDYSFIREEFHQLGYTYSRKQLCTLRLTRAVFPEIGKYSLSNLKRVFKIKSERAHRAYDDAYATSIILDEILRIPNGKLEADQLINHGIKYSKFPPVLDVNKIHALPESAGVYYMHNDHGDVVYIGKSLNIKERVFQHFRSMTAKASRMYGSVCDITFELTGTEMIALLKESMDIKNLKPEINKALRSSQKSWTIVGKVDDEGYLQFQVIPTNKLKEGELVIAEHLDQKRAKLHLKTLYRNELICSCFREEDRMLRPCLRHRMETCPGAGQGGVSPEDYNENILSELVRITEPLPDNSLIIGPGRKEKEHSYVWVEGGNVMGYGFFDNSYPLDYTDLELIQFSQNQKEVKRTVSFELQKAKNLKVVPLSDLQGFSI